MDIMNWLNKPYPLVENQRDKFVLVLAFSLFTYVFLLLYKPFGSEQIGERQVWFQMGFALSVLLSLAFNYFLLPRLFKSWFSQENWKIKKEILYVIFSFCLIAVLNYLYNSSVGRDFAPQYNVFQFLGITLAVGIFPLIIMVFLIEMFLNRRNSAEALQLSQQMVSVPTENPVQYLNIQPETTRSAALTLPLSDFLFAVSDNNYSTVFYRKDGKTEKQLLRLSLKNLETQLDKFDPLVRCHRSYLVNINRITAFKGNARSMTLELEGFEGSIPVSRSFPKEKLVARS